ncbi:MAG: RsmE family RNA methyltransferase, partial [Rhodoglobus sp.]
RSWLPDVLDLVSTKQLAGLAAGARMLVLEPTARVQLSALELDERDIVLVVGPEGGISSHELELLSAAGAEPVRLGTEVLRTSTAGPAALAAVAVKLGRW